MRKSERRAKAWEAILLLAQKGSVVIFGRGIDSQANPLYQVQHGDNALANSKGFINLTEEQIVKKLLE
jgi:hypothetical protein